MTTSPRGFSWGPLSFESNALFTDVVVIVRRQASAVNSRNHRLIKALLGFPWRWRTILYWSQLHKSDAVLLEARTLTCAGMKRHRDNAEHYCWGDGCDGWHLLQSETLSVIEEQMPHGASVRLSAREGLHISPGAQHRITNMSSETLEFLVISEPPSHGDRINVEGKS